MPLARRVPKFGFTNIFRQETHVVNLRDFDRFDAGAVVDAEALQKIGLLNTKRAGRWKVLAAGEIKKALTIKAPAFSKGAVTAIEKAGGKAEVVK